MKKNTSILAALVLMITLCTTAFADGEYATAGDLYQAWYERNGYENPYPDYITGVWSADGSMDSLVFGVTKDDAGLAGQEEILRLVADDSTVSFTYQSYSYAELAAVQREITPRMGEQSGAYVSGVYDMENVVKIGVDKNNPNAEAFMAEMFEKYGDRVAFEMMDGAIVTLEDTLADTTRDKGGAQHYWYILFAAVLFAAGALLLRRRAVSVAVTDKGAVVSESSVLTSREVESLYREEMVSPSKEMDEKILAMVDTEK